VFLRVADDLGGGVEAHGLRIQKRGGEDVGVVALDPRRVIDEEREACGVAFGEAVIAEAFDLFETAGCEVAFVAVLDHAGDELVFEGFDRT
jgi:hypothetical protein